MIRKMLTCRLGAPQAFPLPAGFRYVITSVIGRYQYADGGGNTIPVLKSYKKIKMPNIKCFIGIYSNYYDAGSESSSGW